MNTNSDIRKNPFMHTVDRLPLNIVRGEGSRLIDDKGNGYIDLWGDEGVAALGYGPTFNLLLVDFIEKRVPHRLPDMYHNDVRTRCALALTEQAIYDKLFFCNSGAEANEAAIKLAKRYWSMGKGDNQEKKVILTLEGNFHGRSGFALAASDSLDSPYHKIGYGAMAPCFGVIGEDLDIDKARFWDHERGHYIPYTHLDWSRVAAIQMAPILGNNTVKTYPESFWVKMSELRNKHGFLLNFDEVQVGMGRTGYFCAHHNPQVTFGVRPDILCLGKGISLGLPAAAILADDRVASAFVPGVHFSTFGGGMLTSHMTLALIDWLKYHQDSVRCKEITIRAEFQRMMDEGLITGFDGVGVHWGFTPNWSGPHRDGFEFIQAALKHWVILVTHRPLAPIRFTPPLNISEADLTSALWAVRETALGK